MNTRTAKKAATKTATAKKAPAKKPATPPARKRTAKKTAPAPASDRGTQVDLRKPLQVRRPSAIGPLSAEELAASRAILASAMLRLPIPILAWHGPTATLKDGTRLTHTDPRPPAFTTNTEPPTFTAHVPCPHGAHHQHHIRSAADLAEARALTRLCNTAHAQPTQHEGETYDWDKAARHGVAPIPAPRTAPVFHLQEGIHRTNAAAADTQPLTRDQINAGLADRAREHPDQDPE